MCVCVCASERERGGYIDRGFRNREPAAAARASGARRLAPYRATHAACVGVRCTCARERWQRYSSRVCVYV